MKTLGLSREERDRLWVVATALGRILQVKRRPIKDFHLRLARSCKAGDRLLLMHPSLQRLYDALRDQTTVPDENAV